MPVHTFSTAIGPCSIGWQEKHVTQLSLLTSAADSGTAATWLKPIIVRVQRHLRSGGEDFADVALAWSQVSRFQKRVYLAAQEIKSGHTSTYGDLARAIGETPATSRAVGTALGQNPWLLLVPCHRLVGSNGKLTGFSAPGGIDTKLKLLSIEGNQLFAA